MTTLLRDLGRLALPGLVSLPLLIGPVAQAAPITFDMQWDGTLGSSASAFGSITLDRTTLPDSGSSFGLLADSGVTALSVTVSGATLTLFGLGGLLLAARRYRPASGRSDALDSR